MTRKSATSCRICRRKTESRNSMCKTCQVEVPLTGGRWVLGPRRVLVWEPDAAPTDRELRAAHCAYARGVRQPSVVDLEREYQRGRDRGREAA